MNTTDKSQKFVVENIDASKPIKWKVTCVEGTLEPPETILQKCVQDKESHGFTHMDAFKTCIWQLDKLYGEEFTFKVRAWLDKQNIELRRKLHNYQFLIWKQDMEKLVLREKSKYASVPEFAETLKKIRDTLTKHYDVLMCQKEIIDETEKTNTLLYEIKRDQIKKREELRRLRNTAKRFIVTLKKNDDERKKKYVAKWD